MTIIIRSKTVKALAGFLVISLIFAGGYQLKDVFNPQTAMSPSYIAKSDPEVVGTVEDLPVGFFTPEADQAGDQLSETDQSNTTDYRISRAIARSQELQLLETLSQDTTISDLERQSARNDLLLKIRQMEAEVECEGALTAKGFQEVLVTIRGQKVTILMKTNFLEQEELLQISDIVCGITGCSEEGIILIPN